MLIKIIKNITSIKFCLYCYKINLYGNLCINCWLKLKFWNNELCGICNRFSINECYECNLTVKVIFIYNEIIKDLILKFKYNNKFFIGKIFINYLINLYVPKNDLVILYIPHYFTKQLTTSFNSSLLLAYEFQKQFGGVLFHNILKKITKLRQKNTKNFKERTNTHNRFIIQNKHLIKNKNIVLIDDILTTGSTINTCGLLIKTANPLSLQIFSLAKIY